MDKTLAKLMTLLCIVLLFLTIGLVQAQAADVPALSAGAPPMTADQSTAVKNLAPAQKGAIATELGKTGGQLTPGAVDALKASPEFQGLTPEEVAKGKELLQKQEAAKKEAEIIKSPGGPKMFIGETAKGESLFERARDIGKYQDISLDLRPFGYDFFRDAAVRVITDRRDIPIPMKYVVGPGDEVKLVLWGRINASYTLTVDRDGKIAIPNIGPLAVAGMTFEQMSTYLIKQAEQITGTNVDISMGALRTIPVFILGDVRRPGAYTIGASATITDSLLLAGGPSEIGSMRNIQLKRKDKVIDTLDLYDLLLKGDKSRDVILQAGDIVFVPVIGPYVGIAGSVKRPALYELKDKFSLEYLFDLAGGLIPTAYTQQIQVERTIKNERQIVIDIDDKGLSKVRFFPLQDADLVKVFPIMDKDVNVVYLSGNVKRGGKYALNAGMRLKDILKDTSELLPETYFDYALIKRLRPPGMDSVLVPVNLGDLLLRNVPESNIELQPQDSIFIFSKWFFKDKPFFTINGEVRTPGKFDLADNLKVKDAILAGGNLTRDAYLKKGEIIQVNKKKEYQTLYFDVSKAMADDTAENIPIQDEDQIIIHSLYEEQWKELVTVIGEVKNPGDFIITDKMRVSDLFFKAGGQTRDTLLDRAELYRTNWKTKEVTLKKINLAKALQGDPAENLELQDMDRLIVHTIWEKVYKKNVTIEGDVLKPGTYQMADNMTVRDLVFAAGNILESTYLDNAEISSMTTDGGQTAKIIQRNINLQKALAGDPGHNVAMQPYDRLFVRRIPDWQQERYVTVTGEIRFPGRYIISKGEKITSLIDRAGGYKEAAYLRGAFFTRERVRDLQQKSLIEMADRMERDLLGSAAGISTAISSEEIAAKNVELEQKRKFIDTLRKLKATGRMTVYLTYTRLLKGSEYDIELEEGDTLLIPPKNSVVNVAGVVMSPTSVIYSEKMSYQDYINETGGYGSFADTDNIFVMKVDGSARKLGRGLFNWSSPRQRWEVAGFGEKIPPIEPGDTIVVPAKVERIAWLREIRDITQILMNTSVAAAVILNTW